MRPPNALHLTKVDSIGPVAGAVLVGVDIWPFAKFESGPAGHREDRADPRALNAYTTSQMTSPAVSTRGLRRSPWWADGPAVLSLPTPLYFGFPPSTGPLRLCPIAGRDPLDSRASVGLPLPCFITPDHGTRVVASVVTTRMGISQSMREEPEPSTTDRSKEDSAATDSQHTRLGD